MDKDVELVPSGHCIDDVSRVDELVPSGHCSDDVSRVDELVPSGHCSNDVSRVDELVPSGHCSDDVSRVDELVPSEHCVSRDDEECCKALVLNEIGCCCSKLGLPPSIQAPPPCCIATLSIATITACFKGWVGSVSPRATTLFVRGSTISAPSIPH